MRTGLLVSGLVIAAAIWLLAATAPSEVSTSAVEVAPRVLAAPAPVPPALPLPAQTARAPEPVGRVAPVVPLARPSTALEVNVEEQERQSAANVRSATDALEAALKR